MLACFVIPVIAVQLNIVVFSLAMADQYLLATYSQDDQGLQLQNSGQWADSQDLSVQLACIRFESVSELEHMPFGRQLLPGSQQGTAESLSLANSVHWMSCGIMPPS